MFSSFQQSVGGAFLMGILLFCGTTSSANRGSRSNLVKDNSIRITIVYDNNPYKKGLKTAWGFGCLVEGLEETILFDTGGEGDILMDNMKKLHVDPDDVDAVVISHIHQDHCGGLPAFLKHNHRRSGKTMKTIEIVDGRHPVTAGCPRRQKIYYQNGPLIEPGKDVRMLARYEDGGGAIVCGNRGKGRIVIFSPHPEGSLEKKVNPAETGTLKLLENAVEYVLQSEDVSR
ncbi:MAG: MBL fold metallo-hydrolase [Candidatus Brocadiia bacterium]